MSVSISWASNDLDDPVRRNDPLLSHGNWHSRIKDQIGTANQCSCSISQMKWFGTASYQGRQTTCIDSYAANNLAIVEKEWKSSIQWFEVALSIWTHLGPFRSYSYEMRFPSTKSPIPVSSKILDVSAVHIKQISSIYSNITAYVITSPLGFTGTLKTFPNDMVLDSTRLQKLVSCSSRKSRAIRETQTKANRSDYLAATRVAREAVLPRRSPLKTLSLLL